MPSFAGSVLVVAAASLTCLMAQPRYTSDGQLMLPNDYREWVFVSTGFGMSYSPPAGHGGSPAFFNVFANPAAYRSFVKTGTWPERTMLLLELRASASKGSIIRDGYYQGELLGIEGEVKDRSRFSGNGWAFFAFSKSSTGIMQPRTQDCYSCHLEDGAVDNTFVQFYPVLLGIAKQKGTLTPTYLHDSAGCSVDSNPPFHQAPDEIIRVESIQRRYRKRCGGIEDGLVQPRAALPRSQQALGEHRVEQCAAERHCDHICSWSTCFCQQRDADGRPRCGNFGVLHELLPQLVRKLGNAAKILGIDRRNRLARQESGKASPC